MPGIGARLRHAAPWVAIFAVALGLRVAYVYQIRTIPYFDTLVGDAASYDAWAQRIAGGDWMGSKVFYQAPAYPYMLGVIYSVAGRNLLVARLVQAALGAAAALLLGLAGRAFFNRSIGLTAGVLLALYPPAIFFDGLIQKTSLATVLMAGVLFVLGTLRYRPAAWKWLVAGVLLGLFGLTRENALVLIAVVGAWLWLGFRRRPVRSRLVWSAAGAAGLVLTLGPVAVRNHAVGGEFAITTVQAGPNFYIGNHPNATGRYMPLVRGHESPPFERQDATRLAEQAVGHELSPGQVSRFWLDRAADFITSAPLQWLRLMGKKFLLVFNHYEITDVEGYNVYRDFSYILGWLSLVLHFGVICPLAAAGLAATWSRRRGLGVLYAILIATSAAVALFYVLARYRFPVVIVLILFAAAGIVEGYRLWQAADRRRLAAPAIALMVAAIVCNLRINPERQLDAMAYSNLGGVLAQRGDLAAATGVFRIALEENPASPELRYNLGLAYLLRGEPEAAIKQFQEALRLDPSLVEVDYQLGVAYESLGDKQRALYYYQRALKINPDDKEAQAAVDRLSGQGG